jgi:hypothetical protein
MHSTFRSLFGGKATKPSRARGAGSDNASSTSLADPTGVEPPLLTSVFGRPPSYTYATPNTLVAPGPPRSTVEPTLNTIPEDAPVGARTQRDVPIEPGGQIDNLRWPIYDTNNTFYTKHPDAVSTFVPEAQPWKPSAQDNDEEHGESSTAGFRLAVRPPTERALRMQSRDVTNWRQMMGGTKRPRDSDKIFVSMAVVPEAEKPPTPQVRPIPIEPIPQLQDMAMTDKDLEKPTCSLNLICYRPGTQGCVLRQVRVVDKQRFKHETDYEEAVEQDPDILETDREFFEAMRNEYNEHMCSFWRRYLSLKTLRIIRLLSVRSPSLNHHIMYD